MSGVRALWQGKYFSALQLASISPWKLKFSPHRIFVSHTSILFLQLHRDVSNLMLLIAMLIVRVMYRKWSNGRPRSVYLILRVEEGEAFNRWEAVKAFILTADSYKCNQLSKTNILLSKISRAFKNGGISSPYFWYILCNCFKSQHRRRNPRSGTLLSPR